MMKGHSWCGWAEGHGEIPDESGGGAEIRAERRVVSWHCSGDILFGEVKVNSRHKDKIQPFWTNGGKSPDEKDPMLNETQETMNCTAQRSPSPLPTTPSPKTQQAPRAYHNTINHCHTHIEPKTLAIDF